jgi:hypothetical protein
MAETQPGGRRRPWRQLRAWWQARRARRRPCALCGLLWETLPPAVLVTVPPGWTAAQCHAAVGYLRQLHPDVRFVVLPDGMRGKRAKRYRRLMPAHGPRRAE